MRESSEPIRTTGRLHRLGREKTMEEFESFYHRHEMLVKGILTHMMGIYNGHYEDASQVTWLKIWRSIGSMDAEHEVAWISQIARRTAIDFLRQLKARNRLDGFLDNEVARETIEDTDISFDPIYSGFADAFEEVFSRLSPQDKVVLSFLLQGYRAREITIALKTDKKTTYNRIRLAREHIRDHVEELVK